MFLPCFTCAKEFESVQALKQHKQDKMHLRGPNSHEEWTTLQALESYFKAYYEEQVSVMRKDRRKSRRVVMKTLTEMRRDFQYEIGADLFSKRPQNAGSTSTQTKVYLADEYDFNLYLDIDMDDLEVLIQGKSIWYEVDEQPADHVNHLSEKWSIDRTRRPLTIPQGYAAVRITDPESYDNEDWWSRLTFRKFMIPRFIQEDLYEKASESMEDNNVTTVSDRKHGPAITMNIAPGPVDHHISVDLVAALPINKTASCYGWPRRSTWNAIPEPIIQEVLKENLYLVPKANNFWYISFANPAKVLLRSIDSHGECRILVHRTLKRDFMKWKSEISYPGISTYMFKNHLFWFNEQLPSNIDRKEYWKHSNIGQCYMDFLIDFAKRLEEQELFNYFNPTENILIDKDMRVLNHLANKMRARRNQLIRIVAI